MYNLQYRLWPWLLSYQPRFHVDRIDNLLRCWLSKMNDLMRREPLHQTQPHHFPYLGCTLIIFVNFACMIRDIFIVSSISLASTGIQTPLIATSIAPFTRQIVIFITDIIPVTNHLIVSAVILIKGFTAYITDIFIIINQSTETNNLFVIIPDTTKAPLL